MAMLQEFLKKFILGTIIITLGTIGILFCMNREYLGYFMEGFLILKTQIQLAVLVFGLLVIFTQFDKRR